MQYLYYLNTIQFSEGDTTKAFKFAKKLIKEDSNIDTITFLVYQSNHYEPFLRELGIKSNDCKKHIIFNKDGLIIQVHTVRTYDPKYAIQGDHKCEILISVGVPPQELHQFVDKSRVKYWILVPWLLEENKSFLSVHTAIDLATGDALNSIADVDNRVKGAVKWLFTTSYPNQGYHHPFDNNRLKQMSNALAYFNVPLDFDSVHHYCINNGMLDSSARMTADYFVKAQSQKFTVDRNTNYDFLKQMMEDNDNYLA